MKKQGAILFLFLVFSASSNIYSQSTVYLRPTEALKLIFKDSKEVIKEDYLITEKIREQARRILNYDLPKSSYTFYLGRTNGKIDGYALIDEQIGKAEPITFITRINPNGKVSQVEIMVYRESHGGEVATKRFLNQFREKSFNDEIRLHGNVISVTGATLSSQALVIGVRRALVLWQIFYGKN